MLNSGKFENLPCAQRYARVKSSLCALIRSEGTSSSDGLREEVVRLKEENESLRSRIRELIKRREDVVSEPESLAEGI